MTVPTILRSFGIDALDPIPHELDHGRWGSDPVPRWLMARIRGGRRRGRDGCAGLFPSIENWSRRVEV